MLSVREWRFCSFAAIVGQVVLLVASSLSTPSDKIVAEDAVYAGLAVECSCCPPPPAVILILFPARR